MGVSPARRAAPCHRREVFSLDAVAIAVVAVVDSFALLVIAAAVFAMALGEPRKKGR